MSYSTFNPMAEQYAIQGYHSAGQLLNTTLSKVYDAVPGDATTAVFAAMLQAGAALEFIAGVMAAPVDGDKTVNLSKETMLVAALVTARSIIPSKNPDGSLGIISNFHPHNVLQALEAAKKITGIDIEKLMDERMLSVYRDGADRDNRKTLGYWDYLEGVGPDFDDMADAMTMYSKTHH